MPSSRSIRGGRRRRKVEGRNERGGRGVECLWRVSVAALVACAARCVWCRWFLHERRTVGVHINRRVRGPAAERRTRSSQSLAKEGGGGGGKGALGDRKEAAMRRGVRSSQQRCSCWSSRRPEGPRPHRQNSNNTEGVEANSLTAERGTEESHGRDRMERVEEKSGDEATHQRGGGRCAVDARTTVEMSRKRWEGQRVSWERRSNNKRSAPRVRCEAAR